MSPKYQVFFKFSAHYDTRSVEVIGDFNDWKPGSLALEDDDGDNIWWGQLRLSSGRYKYKFLVDGKDYRLDNLNPLIEKEDGFENSVLEVGDARLKEDIIHSPEDINFVNNGCFYVRARLNKKMYSHARLILVVDDFIKTINGFELYRDEVYIYMLFKAQSDFSPHNMLYYFEADRLENGHDYFGENGIVNSEWEVENFEFEKPDGTEAFITPEWVRDAVFYQIFPERFCNGNHKLNPDNIVDESVLPKADTFYGGDLEGVIKKIPYLKELGINSIYFNPIFDASSTHKYDTSDYMKIDENFGDEKVFDKLSSELKKKDIRFILDGVFNHTGTDFFAFKDIEKNGAKSDYIDWYFVKKHPLTEKDGKHNYECWWNFPSLPKLNTDNPETRQYLLKASEYWITKGSCGWRLDVPNEIDHPFWKEFRDEVKKANPEAYIVGEIWESGLPWLQGDEFDAVMNYIFRSACIEFFAMRKINAHEFVKQVGNQIFQYPMQSNFTMLNLLSSHDTSRFFTVAENDITRVILALAFQFTYLGAPSIYYGEEIGMEGGKDPDNRRFMIWDEGKWNKDLLSAYRRLIQIRQENEVLRRGDIRFFYVKKDTFAFERFTKNEKLYVLINNSEENINLDITRYAGNGDFVDIYRDYPLKRKRAYTLYGNDFVILKKVKERS